MNTYGVHGIHGRAPALATGLALARDDLSIWVVSGDGDALSIGGNHLIHALRRNVPIKILLFNNQIYGLTKGQYSPTSEEGKVTKSTPFGSLDHPFNPVALALGAEASFVARTVDTDRGHEAEVLRAAADHEGSALIEIYQNCNVFNDGAFDAVRAKGKEANQIRLEHGSPIRFGAEGERGVVRDRNGALRIANVAEVGEDALLVHDAHDPNPSNAFALAHLAPRPSGPTPIGVFRAVERPVYGETVAAELEAAREGLGAQELNELLRSGDTWTVVLARLALPGRCPTGERGLHAQQARGHARQDPVPAPEQRHHRGHQQGPDHGRVEQDPGGQAGREHLQVRARAGCQRYERQEQDQRGARHQAAGAADPAHDRGARVAGSLSYSSRIRVRMNTS